MAGNAKRENNGRWNSLGLCVENQFACDVVHYPIQYNNYAWALRAFDPSSMISNGSFTDYLSEEFFVSIFRNSNQVNKHLYSTISKPLASG